MDSCDEAEHEYCLPGCAIEMDSDCCLVMDLLQDLRLGQSPLPYTKVSHKLMNVRGLMDRRSPSMLAREVLALELRLAIVFDHIGN